MKFYVLIVSPQKEIVVLNTLIENAYSAFVPRENRLIRSGGKWKLKEYILFPSYVFVGLEEITNKDYYRIKSFDNINSFLGLNTPQAISYDEARRLKFLAPDNAALQPSVIEFDKNGTPHVVSGVLQSLPIVKINRHKRRAAVNFDLGEKLCQTEFSFIPKK